MRQAQLPQRAAHAPVLRASVFRLRRQMSEVFGQETHGVLGPGLEQLQQRSPEQRAHCGLRHKLSLAVGFGRVGVGHDDDTGAALLRHRFTSASRPAAKAARKQATANASGLAVRGKADRKPLF